MAFDNWHRSTENNTYCTDPSYGCGVFGAVDGTFQTPDGQYSGTVTEDSSIAEYLNNDYYTNTLNATSKNQMISHSFNIGSVQYLDVSGNDSITKNIAGEQMYKWTGNVGLINVSDILKASTNPLCTSATVSHDGENECNSNYLLDLDPGTANDIRYWTINAASNEFDPFGNSAPSFVWYTIMGFDGMVAALNSYPASDTYGIRPVVFLKYNITLSGEGTNSNPYTIN